MSSAVVKPRSSGIEALRGPDAPNSQIKEQYGSVYELVLKIDEQRRHAGTVAALLDARALAARATLVQHVDELIFQPHTQVGRKAREILWRKGYYDIVAKAKQLLAKQPRGADADADTDADAAETAGHKRQLAAIIDEGIRTYRSVIVRMNRYFKLDLQLLIDFERLYTPGGDFLDAEALYSIDTFPLQLISYGLDSVHAALLSLGDLHRYRLDLQLHGGGRAQPAAAAAAAAAAERAYAAQFYYDAFKLNTKLGQAQNQLGTLYLGHTHDLDAVYYYLYALQCEQPFQLAEHNVKKIFAANATARARMDAAEAAGGGGGGGTIDTFMTRFVRLAQICYYDQQNGDGELQALGHWALADLRRLLGDGERDGRVCSAISGGGRQPGEFLFKVVATLLFGMRGLADRRSATLDMVNALMVALCAELVKAANRSVERLLAARQRELEHFVDQYGQLYELFDRTVRTKRQLHRESGALGAAKPTATKATKAAAATNASRGEHSSSASSVSSMNRGAPDAAKQPEKAPAAAKSRAKKQRNCRRRRRFDDDDDDNDDDNSDEEDEDSDDSSSDDSDSDAAAAAQSDYELDTDFGSTDGEKDDAAGAGFSDEDVDELVANRSSGSSLLEGEHFVYPNGTDAVSQSPIESMLREYMRIGSPVAKATAATAAAGCGEAIGSPAASVQNEAQTVNGNGAGEPDNLRFKRRYTKPDPNVVIEFAQHDCTLPALNVLFGWLQQQPQLLAGCYDSNPEFFDGIVRLLNHLNVDLFTNKVYFERSMVRTTGLRTDLERLFAMRAAVPLTEDERLKDFALLSAAQLELDYEVPLRECLTEPEEHLVRMFKLVDFGFQLAKSRQYGMRFCVRTRCFVTGAGRGGATAATASGQPAGGLDGPLPMSRSQGRRRQRRRQAKRMGFGGGGVGGGSANQGTSNEENEVAVAVAKSMFTNMRKGYLKHRNQNNVANGTADTVLKDVDSEFPALSATINGNCAGNAARSSPPTTPNKMALMGKLWLRSEVQALESEVGRRPGAGHVATPFLVVDALALADYSHLIKRLIKSQRFVVLVPSAALSDLDAMKKTSDGARQAIRWLETEIGRGSRYMRMQRSYEQQPIPLLKLPRRLERDDYNFVQIAQFCNYMQASHVDDQLDGSTDGSVVTLLTGADLAQREAASATVSAPLSYTGVLLAIAPVHWEPIAAFYAKHTKK